MQAHRFCYATNSYGVSTSFQVFTKGAGYMGTLFFWYDEVATHDWIR